jgi:4-oxalocrotonate tautomerase
MSAEKLEELGDTVAAILRDPTRLHGPKVRYQDRLRVDAVEVVSEVEHLQRQLAAVDLQERRLLERYLRDDTEIPAGVARDRVEALGRQRAGLEAQLTAAQARQAAQTAARGRQDAIRAACGSRPQNSMLALEGRRELLGPLLDEITIVEHAIIIQGALPMESPESEVQAVPNITVQWLAGRTPEQRRQITAAITDAMVRIGKTTADQVHIVFQDVEKDHWGVNGKLASD